MTPADVPNSYRRTACRDHATGELCCRTERQRFAHSSCPARQSAKPVRVPIWLLASPSLALRPARKPKLTVAAAIRSP